MGCDPSRLIAELGRFRSLSDLAGLARLELPALADHDLAHGPRLTARQRRCLQARHRSPQSACPQVVCNLHQPPALASTGAHRKAGDDKDPFLDVKIPRHEVAPFDCTALRQRRESLGLSQSDLAQQAGLSRQTVNAIETGRTVPALDVALAIATAVAAPVESLFRRAARRSRPRIEATLIGPSPRLAGTRVALAQIGDRWLSYAPNPRPPDPAGRWGPAP